MGACYFLFNVFRVVTCDEATASPLGGYYLVFRVLKIYSVAFIVVDDIVILKVLVLCSVL